MCPSLIYYCVCLLWMHWSGFGERISIFGKQKEKCYFFSFCLQFGKRKSGSFYCGLTTWQSHRTIEVGNLSAIFRWNFPFIKWQWKWKIFAQFNWNENEKFVIKLTDALTICICDASTECFWKCEKREIRKKKNPNTHARTIFDFVMVCKVAKQKMHKRKSQKCASRGKKLSKHNQILFSI